MWLAAGYWKLSFPGFGGDVKEPRALCWWHLCCTLSSLLPAPHTENTASDNVYLSATLSKWKHFPWRFNFPRIWKLCCLLLWCSNLNPAGAIHGRSPRGQRNFPCPVSAVPGPIPEKMELRFHCFPGGILPLLKVCHRHIFLGTRSIMSLAAGRCCGHPVMCTCFLLSAGDSRWQQMSLLPAASAAIYVLMYSLLVFFHNKCIWLVSNISILWIHGGSGISTALEEIVTGEQTPLSKKLGTKFSIDERPKQTWAPF